MITQSFLYNAIFFTYALVLTKIYHVAETDTLYYFIFFALGNLIGPLTIGRFFDTIGRRRMISGTYLVSGALLALSAVLFDAGALNAVTQTMWWCVIFFFASSGASAAYLTVSEVFPVEVRAKAISVFFAIAQSFGALGPWLYGQLIGTGQDHFKLFIGYLIGAAVMMLGGVVALVLGVPAEQKSLEDVATPLSLDGPPWRHKGKDRDKDRSGSLRTLDGPAGRALTAGGRGRRRDDQSRSGRVGAATRVGFDAQSTPGTSMYSSISLPSGSVMYRLWVTVWSRGADHVAAGVDHRLPGGSQLVVRIADLEPEVITARPVARPGWPWHPHRPR